MASTPRAAQTGGADCRHTKQKPRTWRAGQGIAAKGVNIRYGLRRPLMLKRPHGNGPWAATRKKTARRAANIAATGVQP